MGHGCPTIIMVNNVNVILTLLDGLQRDMPGSCPRCQRSIDGTDLLGASSAANERAPYLLQKAAVGGNKTPGAPRQPRPLCVFEPGPRCGPPRVVFFCVAGAKASRVGQKPPQKACKGAYHPSWSWVAWLRLRYCGFCQPYNT
jgi:hypothetical protein